MSKFSKDDLKKLGYREVSPDVFEPAKKLIREVLGKPQPKIREKKVPAMKVKAVPGVYEFDITPMGKPRMTQRDKWAKRPVVERYYEFANRLRALAALNGFVFPATGAHIRFELPMPESWKKKKYKETTMWNFMNMNPHQAKPDLDNMLKAVKDSLCKDDKFIHSYTASKTWAEKGKITISF